MMQPANCADLIVLARKIHTFCPQRPRVKALAIRAGRIVAVGGHREVVAYRGRRTRVMELGDAIATPGLVDCHTHFFYWALARALIIDLSATRTLDEALTRLVTESRTRHVGEWVLAHGFDQNLWGRDFPQAADLDRVIPDRPVIARTRDAHTAWLNSMALRRCGISRATADPPGGCYARNAHGEPVGIVHEAAVNLLPDPLRELAQDSSPRARRAIDRALEAAYRNAGAHGLVGVHSVDETVGLVQFQRHHAEGRLGLRLTHAINLDAFERARGLGLRSGLGDEWFRIGGLKLFADGSLGSQTAYMFEPYPGRGDYCGMPVVAGNELRQLVQIATRDGWAVWIHAIGDRAVHEVIAAIVAARRAGKPAMPPRIEHVQCARPADVRRMARAGIVASVQPCHILGDIPTAQRHWPRAQRDAYALRRMVAAGVTLAAGSDVPIESLDPRRGLYAAVTRMDTEGAPVGGWFPEQRLTIEEALRAYTVGAARAVGQPAPAGTLAPGALGDLTVWAADPLRVSPGDLLHIGIAGCIVGGRVHLHEQET